MFMCQPITLLDRVSALILLSSIAPGKATCRALALCVSMS